ncbi:response regulator [Glaciibacter superstes]|uniref:response regulator n=1 Tax=Glaciibacter superstes TaxID=501023 RepID=UPI0003B52C23|nr:response regulator transcription factor [Glaciibacter superstes]
MIRVFLLDDHEVVRRGVANLLDAEPDIEVVGEASTAAQARGRIDATRPDIAILDVRLPDGSGIDVCRDLHSKDSPVRCIMLTGYDDEDAVYAAVIAGAAGYVVKDIQGGKLVDSVRAVAAGRTLLDPRLARRAVDSLRSGADGDSRLDSLSVRERQVLALVADGLTNRQIGEELALAEKTVKNYMSSLLAKLGLQRRTQAAIVQLESRHP